VRYLTAAEVIELNRRVVTGGSFFVRDRHRIEYLVEIVQDNDHFPSIWDKAAMYVHRLAHSQAFLDGNKRTALEAGDIFLTYNGYDFQHPGVGWTVRYMMAIARNEKTLKQVRNWLRRHSRDKRVKGHEGPDRGTENPRVGGSSPSPGTMSIKRLRTATAEQHDLLLSSAIPEIGHNR
jgi:death-on-curing protein